MKTNDKRDRDRLGWEREEQSERVSSEWRIEKKYQQALHVRLYLYGVCVCVFKCGDSRVHIGGLTSDLFSFQFISLAPSLSLAHNNQCDNRVLRILSSFRQFSYCVCRHRSDPTESDRIEIKRIQSRFALICACLLCSNFYRNHMYGATPWAAARFIYGYGAYIVID